MRRDYGPLCGKCVTSDTLGTSLNNLAQLVEPGGSSEYVTLDSSPELLLSWGLQTSRFRWLVRNFSGVRMKPHSRERDPLHTRIVLSTRPLSQYYYQQWRRACTWPCKSDLKYLLGLRQGNIFTAFPLQSMFHGVQRSIDGISPSRL